MPVEFFGDGRNDNAAQLRETLNHPRIKVFAASRTNISAAPARLRIGRRVRVTATFGPFRWYGWASITIPGLAAVLYPAAVSPAILLGLGAVVVGVRGL